ncbi:unnamed protein product [Linum tenue]|uniref:Protein kinase domain-containing protein n=2 Tax=Linum tenue TaxID=586396 RepID=A0AAV0REL1_9ROSI|nr:unnamed protein product [Linum tenue]
MAEIRVEVSESEGDQQQEDPNASVFQSRTFPRYCPRPRPTQTQYIPATPRAIAAASGATPSNSDLSSRSRASSSDTSSFFFTISSSSSSSSSSHTLSIPQSSTSSYLCTFRGKDAIGFRRVFPPTINREKLKQHLSVIGSIRHANVVQLIGASMYEKEPCVNLMYPFVNGATLSDCLTSRSTTDLYSLYLGRWQSRMDIAVGVARGLNYIHHMTGFEALLVHNRIKTSNIILLPLSGGAAVKPLICKFGLAHAAGEAADEDEDNVGWGGGEGIEEVDEEENPYMSPEVRRGGSLATRKSDVYAFGVLLLELISGAEPVTYRYNDVDKVYVRKSIMETARAAEAGDEEMVRGWVDGRLNGLFPVEVAKEAMRLGLYCLGEDPRSRPDMGLVEGLIFDCWRRSNKPFF